MYKSSDVADRLRAVAKIRGLSMASVLSDCGLNFNAMTHMRKSMPNAGNLAKLADRLECSVDYLLGRTTEMLTPGAEQSPAQLQDLQEAPQAREQTPRNTAEMIALFELLPDREQVLFIGRLQEAVARSAGEAQGGGSGSSPAKVG